MACLVAAGLALALPSLGCNLLRSDFDIAVGNRMANPVSVFANGAKLGDVGAHLTATFTVNETPLGRATTSAATPITPGPLAQVTVSARDMTTGVLSAGVAATLVADVTTYVDVTPCVVTDGESAAPCLSVSNSSSSVSGTTGSVGQLCTLSLSESGQSFNAPGGTGSVSVNTSSSCAWNATSSDNWLTVVTGASGTGTGVVVYRVAANTTGQARSASLSIGRQTFTVNQAG